MPSISLDLSGKIDALTIAILEHIDRASGLYHIPFLVVGAAARDMILLHGYGIDTGRATRDIDFGVMVADWEAFYRLIGQLVSTGEFNKTKAEHRLVHTTGYLVDIIPFGGVASHAGSITWPQDQERKMSVVGFDECFDHAIAVILRSDPEFIIRVASLAGLCVLKLVAWDEKYPERSKDATDILLIMRNYIDAGNFDRLYEEGLDIFESGDADYETAGVRFLGRDIGKMLSLKSAEAILAILDRETGDQPRCRLVEDLLGGRWTDQNRFDAALTLVEHLKAGILEGIKVR